MEHFMCHNYRTTKISFKTACEILINLLNSFVVPRRKNFRPLCNDFLRMLNSLQNML